MKKRFFIILVVILIGGIYGYQLLGNHTIPTNFQMNDKILKNTKKIIPNNIPLINKEEWIYSPLRPYLIFSKGEVYDFEVFDSALRYAKKNGYKEICFQDEQTLIWEEDKKLTNNIRLQLPHLLQKPELDRGCEVTSLAMILQYYGYNVNKVELAERVKKDTTPYSVNEQGYIYYGNPYEGFVGDIYNIEKNGYGVYHGPIVELAKEYVGDKVIDLTGANFESILQMLDEGMPVWVVTNGAFKLLNEEEFQLWHTPTGIVKITKRMHAVVITGYDSQYIYINDPLYPLPNRKVNRADFKASWEQMGNQAVTILNK